MCTGCAIQAKVFLALQRRKRRWTTRQMALFETAPVYLSAGLYCDLGEVHAQDVGLPSFEDLVAAGQMAGLTKRACSQVENQESIYAPRAARE